MRLLVIDDDDLVLQSVKMSAPESWMVTCCNDYKSIPPGHYHAALVDLHLTGNIERAEGVEVIKGLSHDYTHMEIIAISGDLNRELMEMCLKAGASRFLAKPLSPEEIQLVLGKIEALVLLQGAIGRPQVQKWVGESQQSENLRRQIADMAGEPGPILIEGESGTGKEVVAHLLHAQDPSGPFVALNVAAIPENLFESELFGHAKGAFTGASQTKVGLAEAADGGHLFIDEIEALPLSQQVKLLRFLESGEIRRVGSQDNRLVRTRVIIATNRNLEEMVRNGEFREDLLWRINGKKLSLPPLRERSSDVAVLAKHFISQDKIRKKQASDEALCLLSKHSWPGNVRELKRVCEQLLARAPLPIIREEDVNQVLSNPTTQGPNNLQVDLSQGLSKIVADFEAQIINNCLSDQKDVENVARILKVSRSNLYKKIKDYGIDWRE